MKKVLINLIQALPRSVLCCSTWHSQDASLKLHLCCLLRRAPAVAEAIVVGVGGNKYFDIYLTHYGVSTR